MELNLSQIILKRLLVKHKGREFQDSASAFGVSVEAKLKGHNHPTRPMRVETSAICVRGKRDDIYTWAGATGTLEDYCTVPHIKNGITGEWYEEESIIFELYESELVRRVNATAEVVIYEYVYEEELNNYAWTEIYEDGMWSYTEDDVKAKAASILNNVSSSSVSVVGNVITVDLRENERVLYKIYVD